jgi:hypothetical protein
MAKRPLKHEMLFFVYVLGSRRKDDRRTHVGWTTDLERHLRQHNAGSVPRAEIDSALFRTRQNPQSSHESRVVHKVKIGENTPGILADAVRMFRKSSGAFGSSLAAILPMSQIAVRCASIFVVTT